MMRAIKSERRGKMKGLRSNAIARDWKRASKASIP